MSEVILTTYGEASNGSTGTIERVAYTPTDFDIQMMGLAMSAAEHAAKAGDSPIGAVLVDPDYEVYVEETREFRDDNLFGHAEMALVRRVSPKVGRSLGGCVMYSIAEPCYGCCYLLDKGGISRLYISASRNDVDFFTRKNPEMADIFAHSKRRLEVVSGLILDEAKELLVAENRRHWGEPSFLESISGGA